VTLGCVAINSAKATGPMKICNRYFGGGGGGGGGGGVGGGWVNNSL